MRTEKRYIFEVMLRHDHDVDYLLAALEGAAREWASSSNESEPLLDLRDQIRKQWTNR